MAALLSTFFSRVHALLPDSSHPAAKQKTPFGINRYILLVIYMIYAVLTSSVYFGWRSMSAMLFKSGQFAWVCTGESADTSPEEGETDYLCALQDTKVQSLFTIAMACHFTCSAVAGYLLDTVGPKVVALLGQTLNALAWILLAFSGPNFRSVYAAFVFMGAGADVSVYPTLLISSLFPGSTAFIMAVLGACISTSFFVPLILRTIWDSTDVSFEAVCIGYAVAGPILCAVAAVFFIPLKSFKGVDQFSAYVAAEKLANTPTDLSSPKAEDGLWQQATAVGDSQMCGEGESCDGRVAGSQHTAGTATTDECGKHSSHGVAFSDLSNDPRLKKQEVSFTSQAFTFLYFGICLYFTVCGWVMAYYQEAAGRFLSKDAEYALEILTPLSTIPCLIFGVVINRIGIMPVILLINTIGLLTYVCVAAAEHVVAQYFSVIFFFMYISIFTTQMYVFVESTFDSAHFGKLIGVASLIGGLMSLISNVLYGNVTVGMLNGDTGPVVIVLLLVIVLMYPLLLTMRSKQNAKKKVEQDDIRNRVLELKAAQAADVA
ncbi:putative transporter, major facilitator family domain containing protein [Neospora caninum Liverpool]|uniref:Putative transporter, major facilitator family domain containing protein n=1 Tax=Neospora caninum (strain Liverpool) TaxID=572307 RepID=F0VL63_NEOCL|nr:putative transporter, major facilitator family domain containing protein [Neospora caninum Liverpool]CBZ54815.1 putative transporter, major facilitator family domain containing protein [Neospora caninum Liverpool]CEL69534.1 TPA: transporter, major facilitator family domain containing protein, putative [Neospora caninum Liverpool]|eukprot:XP_003884843.1 putative transporter, major facilitator family domain containing protein [Neospora caninum Liverpool]